MNQLTGQAYTITTERDTRIGALRQHIKVTLQHTSFIEEREFLHSLLSHIDGGYMTAVEVERYVRGIYEVAAQNIRNFPAVGFNSVYCASGTIIERYFELMPCNVSMDDTCMWDFKTGALV